MADDIINAQYDIEKKSKIKRFYEDNKILIFATSFILIIGLIISVIYIKKIEKNKVLISEKYIMSKIYLQNDEKDKAKNILKEIIFSNDSTYSSLSLFLILNQNLIEDRNEILSLFDHVLENNNFDKELKNLLIYKKALFNSNFTNEFELLENIKPLLNDDTLWKPHALLLAGDYFASKNENVKAKDFYIQILSIKNLEKYLYDQAIYQLSLITNDK